MRASDLKIGYEYNLLDRPQAFGRDTRRPGRRVKVLSVGPRTNTRGHPDNVEVEYNDENYPTLDQWKADQIEGLFKRLVREAERPILGGGGGLSSDDKAVLMATAKDKVEAPDYAPHGIYRGRIGRVYSGRIDRLWAEVEARNIAQTEAAAQRQEEQKAEHDRVRGNLLRSGATEAQVKILEGSFARGTSFSDQSRFTFDVDGIKAFLGATT